MSKEKLYCLIRDIKNEGKAGTKVINKAIGHEMMRNWCLLEAWFKKSYKINIRQLLSKIAHWNMNQKVPV